MRIIARMSPLNTLLGLTRGGDVVTTGNGNERTVVCGDPVTLSLNIVNDQ